MYHPAIIIAYYLDSRYHNRLLTNEYSFTLIAEELSEFVDQSLNGQLAKDLLWYNNKTELFSLSMSWKTEAIEDPVDW